MLIRTIVIKCNKIKQLTLIQSDFSLIDKTSVFVYKHLLITCRWKWDIQLEWIKKKLEVSTVDIQINGSGLRIPISKVFSSG